MDSEQQRKLQKQTRPAFALRGAASAKGGRPKDVAQDDVLEDSFSQSEQSRQDIMKMLDRREKDKEEIELESCFSDL